jgi:peptide/nickel transport system substrate-binding protein
LGRASYAIGRPFLGVPFFKRSLSDFFLSGALVLFFLFVFSWTVGLVGSWGDSGGLGGAGGGSVTTKLLLGSELMASGDYPGGGRGVITLPLSRDHFLNNLDPASWNGPIIIHRLIYQGLLEEGPDHTVLPSLAVAWQVSKDGKEYVFYLRKDAIFSSGNPFDSEAVIFNLRRWVNNDLFAAVSASRVESYEALGPYIIKIRFKEASETILRELAYPRPVRFVDPITVSHEIDDIKGYVTHPVGTGPFMLKSFNPEEFVLIPNPYHHGEEPRLSELRFRIIKDGQARLMALRNGELDLAGGDLVGSIPLESLKTLENDSRFESVLAPSLGSVFMAFNNDTGKFDSKDLRAAISYSIDRKAIREDLFDGMVGEATGLFQEGVPHVNEKNNFAPPYDPIKAEELFLKAGYEKRKGVLYSIKDGKPLALTLILKMDENPEWKTLAEYIQASLISVGVDLKLRLLSRNGYNDALNYERDRFDLAIARTYSDLWMPHGFLKEFFQELPGKNVARIWTDPEYRDLVNNVTSVRDPLKREEIYDRILFHISSEYLTVPLYFQENRFFFNKERVLNFEPGVSSYEPINWTTLEAR